MDLHIYGHVGNPQHGLDAASFLNRLSMFDDDEDIDLYINSPGGDPFAALAIMEMLKRHNGKVTTHIDGLAASAATLIMLAGERIIMPSNAMIMIHNPSMISWGDHRTMEKSAEDLKKVRGSMVITYMEGTGLPEEQVESIMDEETWLNAEDAKALGFATDEINPVVESVLAQRLGRFNFEEFEKTPKEFAAVAELGRRQIAAMAAHNHQQGAEDMPKKSEDNQGPAAAPQTPVASANVESNIADLDGAREEGRKGITSLVESVKSLCARVNLPAETSLDIVSQVATGKVTDMEEAQNLVIDAQASTTKTPSYTGVNGGITMGEDGKDKFKAAATSAILARGGIGDRPDGANPYFGMNLHRLAEESIKAVGGRPDYSDRESMVKQALNIKAFGGHSRSDFPEILQDSAEKSVLAGHQEAQETWDQWTRTKSLNNFKEAPMVALSAFDKLEKVSENGEYTKGSITERGEKIQLAKYGKLLQISYEMIIDDDLDQLTDAPRLMGIMAAQIPGDLAYGVLTENATMNETSENLFSAAHGNTFADVLDYDGLSKSVEKMRLQVFTAKDGSERRLNIQPEFLIVPPQLETTALTLMASQVTGDGNQVNIFNGRFKVIVDNRLGDSATQWYLAGNPLANDGVVVGFLNGNPAPFTEQKEMWETDSLGIKIRLECAAAAAGYRALARGGDGS